MSASDVAAVFAAQFSLSHLAWLVAYPIAGWGATRFGLVPAWALLAGIAAVGAVLAPVLWRSAATERARVTVGAPSDRVAGAPELVPGSPAWRRTAAAGGTLTECQCTCGHAA